VGSHSMLCYRIALFTLEPRLPFQFGSLCPRPSLEYSALSVFSFDGRVKFKKGNHELKLPSWAVSTPARDFSNTRCALTAFHWQMALVSPLH
jgi:hypothetical protein